MGIGKPNGSGIEHSAPGQNRHGVPFVSGNLPALATHDGVTVYEAHQNGGVRLLQSRLRRTRERANADRCSGNYPALATHDGVTVYEAHWNGGVLCSSTFGEAAGRVFLSAPVNGILQS